MVGGTCLEVPLYPTTDSGGFGMTHAPKSKGQGVVAQVKNPTRRHMFRQHPLSIPPDPTTIYLT